MDRLDNTDNSRLQRAMLLCLLFYFFWMSVFAPQQPVAVNNEVNNRVNNTTNQEKIVDASSTQQNL